MGDKVWIKVVSANLSRRQLDYEWVIASGLKDGKTKKPVKQPGGEKFRNKRKLDEFEI